jgi:hypothetical protein
MRIRPFVLLLAISAAAASAQNSDLGLLVGISGPSSVVANGSQPQVSGNVSASGQINYAMQLKENSAGRLYLEIPVLLGVRTEGSVSNIVTGSVKTGVYITPGVRFNFTVHPRLSLYAAAGLGPVISHRDQSTIANNVVTSSYSWGVGLVGAVGGGLDVRLTRLISIRGEVRDFYGGNNRVVFGFGMGFHW